MPTHRTGYINYRDLPPDPRLVQLLAAWEKICCDGRLPARPADLLATRPEAAPHASLIEIRQEGGKTRYFVVSEGPAVVAAVGLDGTGTYVDEVGDTPELTTILTVDYDGIRASRKPRAYAEEHHLDGRQRNIKGLQLPFATDGATVDAILEFVYALES